MCLTLRGHLIQPHVPYFIDINLRFPSGGLPLSVASGLDIPNLMIDVMEGKSIQKYIRSKAVDHLTMYRYFEEKFE